MAAVNVDAVGTKSKPSERSWTSNDALLYAVGVGAGADDPASELAYTTENSVGVDQQVLPTFAVIVGGGGADFAAVGEINMANLVHGEQAIELHSARSRRRAGCRPRAPSRASTTRARAW